MDLSLPFDQTVIQRILPHRYPFLLVDRVTEFEPYTRIVGIKNVSRNETYLWREPGSAPTMPFTILAEAIAQVGAIMILGKPENRDRLIFFMGIDKVRFRHPVRAGDQVEIVATVKRLRSRMGTLHGTARVNGRLCCEGTMTFALGKKDEGTGDQPAANV
jgi:3-hydroxyacyl-[acyl-carrier-protein] dehydratase